MSLGMTHSQGGVVGSDGAHARERGGFRDGNRHGTRPGHRFRPDATGTRVEQDVEQDVERGLCQTVRTMMASP
jgi:hypothetical protein